MINSKSQLAIALSRLAAFKTPKIGLEQYTTESEIAAEVLWNANMSGDIQDKTIADMGCGTGILGIGALMLGAKKVYFIDIDKDALEILRTNLASTGIKKGFEIIESDISGFPTEVDMVIQNPPFGTKEKHVDKTFLHKAFSLSDMIYSFHKTATAEFVTKLAKENCFELKGRWDFSYPLKQTMKQHSKRIQRIEVSAFKFVKKS